jgi:hypothetical protein
MLQEMECFLTLKTSRWHPLHSEMNSCSSMLCTRGFLRSEMWETRRLLDLSFKLSIIACTYTTLITLHSCFSWLQMHPGCIRRLERWPLLHSISKEPSIQNCHLTYITKLKKLTLNPKHTWKLGKLIYNWSSPPPPQKGIFGLPITIKGWWWMKFLEKNLVKLSRIKMLHWCKN